MRAEELLDGLTDAQREAVTHGDGPLLVLAGPGSGKTRVITRRAAYLALTITEPRHVLAITFTNKAAREMGERIDAIRVPRGITCMTFHAFCARLLRIYGTRAGIREDFSIFDDSDQKAAMKEAIRLADLSTDQMTPGGVLGVISKAKNNMVSAAEFAAAARGFEDKLLARCYTAYEAVLKRQNALDFDDLLVRTALLLGADAELREMLHDRYRYVLVDEYQDTNHPQYLIARGLALAHENLCVTGDPDQSIYAWRGADVSNILRFEEDFADARVVRLEQNYRSTPQILAAADELIACNKRRKKKRLWTENPAGEAVRVAKCPNAETEAVFIANEIRRLAADDVPYGEMAVFYRTNALSRLIEHQLVKASVPYQVARGVAFYQRKEIKDALAYARVIANPLDEVSLLRIINVPPRGIGKTTVERLAANAAETQRPLREVIADAADIPEVKRAARELLAFAQFLGDAEVTARHGTIRDLLEFLVRNSGLIALYSKDDEESALENLSELINAGAIYDRQHEGDTESPGSLVDWLQQVSLVADVDAVDNKAGAVTLMTLHAAKGLEFDVVFMIGVEEGLLPHMRGLDSGGDFEEERRLCFVGITRARKLLTISHAQYRGQWGVEERRSPSRFLAELPDEGVVNLLVGEEGQCRYDGDDDDEDDLHGSALDYLDWRKGEMVRHAEYGIGRVVWIQPRGGKTHASIRFTAYGEKTLVLEFAKLERIRPDDWD